MAHTLRSPGSRGALLPAALLVTFVFPAAPGRAAPETPPEHEADRAGDLVQEGKAARKAGRLGAAIAAFSRARDLAPGRYEIRILLADTLRRAGRSEAAAPEYAAAVALDPARPEAYAGQGFLRRSAFDYDGAAALLETALPKVGPGAHADLLLNLAETRRRQGRLAEAERLFKEVLAARSGETPALAGLAQVAEAGGDLGSAVLLWNRYLELKPDDEAAILRRQEAREIKASIAALRATAGGIGSAAILTELGRLQAVAGDAAGAADSYRRALRIDPGHADARRGLGLALRDTGDRTGALAQFQRLLKLIPADGTALYNVVALARSAGDRVAEERAWRALIAARPDDLFARRAFVAVLERCGEAALEREIGSNGRHLAGKKDGRSGGQLADLRYRALLFAAARRWPEAGADLYRALRQDPTDPWTLDVAGELLFLRPDLLRALGEQARAESVRAGSAAGGGDTALRVLLARLTWWSGRPGEALIAARRAVAADPHSALARSLLAEAYQEIARDPKLGLEELRQAVALDGTRMADRIDLALALLTSGRAKQAEETVRSALAVFSDAPPALSLLAAALAEQGKLEQAAATYAAALRADPVDNLGLARWQYPLTLAALGRYVEARQALKGDVPPIPEVVYQEAWRFARDAYRDRGFNGQDWRLWRERDRHGGEDVEDTYRAVAAMLASLGDPYTRLRDPEETAAVFLAQHGNDVSVDGLGRNRPHSKTVVVQDLPGGLGYIRLSNLTDPAVVAEIRHALEAMREKEGIVLDLRGNTGGFSRSADAIADLLVGPGKETGADVGPDGSAPQVSAGEGALTDSPVVVLVDGQTGSAAERLARALRATGRGSLLGDTTHGKGVAQISRVLPGGMTVLVSIAEMLGPEGRPIQGRGLDPDPPRERATPTADDPQR